MVRILLRIGLALAGNALGLWVASLLLDKMHVTGAAFVLAVVIFTVAELILEPFIRKVTSDHASALTSVTTLITTFLALLVTDLISDGLSIEGALTWVLATVIVWALTLVFAVVLVRLFVKDEPAAR
jgi:putative membrane protein